MMMMTDHVLGLSVPVALPMHDATLAAPLVDDAIYNIPGVYCMCRSKRGKGGRIGRAMLVCWLSRGVRNLASSAETTSVLHAAGEGPVGVGLQHVLNKKRVARSSH